MMEVKDDAGTSQEPREYDRFANVARQVFAAQRDAVEKRLVNSEQKRKNKRERKKKSAG